METPSHPCIYPTVHRPAQRAVKTWASERRVGTGRAEEGDDGKTLAGGKGLAWLLRRRSTDQKQTEIWLISQSPPIMRCEGERSICRAELGQPTIDLVLWLCPGGEGRRSGWEWDGITSPRPLYRRPATRPVRACHRDETMQWLYHLQRIFIQFSKARSGHHGHSNCPRKANCRRAIAV